jgi:prevent-host-death family protein
MRSRSICSFAAHYAKTAHQSAWETAIMTTISALNAKTHFAELLQQVARGEEVVITKNDKPVARLVPEGAVNTKRVQQAAAGLRELQTQIKGRLSRKPKLSFREVKTAIAEGRR